MRLLKQSTAVTKKMGRFVDVTDAATPETTVTTAARLSKDEGAFGNRSDATPIAHTENGYYNVALNTTDTDTLGELLVSFTDSAVHLPVEERFMVVTASVYDAWRAVGGKPDVRLDDAERLALSQRVWDINMASEFPALPDRCPGRAMRNLMNGYTAVGAGLSVFDEVGGVSHDYTVTADAAGHITQIVKN